MEPIGEGAVDEDEGRGIHPHCDGKSPQAVERKRVAGVHCVSRVRKLLEIKGLNDGDSE